jgi:hypothetical protein
MAVCLAVLLVVQMADNLGYQWVELLVPQMALQ